MNWTVFEMLFGALLLISVIDAKRQPTCDAWSDWCVLGSASIETKDDLKQAEFTKSSKIIFRSPTIKELSSTIMNEMVALEHLQLDGGTVQTIYVKPTLSTLWAQRNSVQVVLIDDQDNYQLDFLEVTFNKLKAVPANINRLKKLITLHLNNNEIEAVDLNALNGLNNLEHLALYKNRIVRVDTTKSLKLPKLIEMKLSENQLEVLNIGLWEFLNLQNLHLHYNKLRKLKGLTYKLTSLKVASIHENRWSCISLLDIMSEFQARNVTVQHEDICPDRKHGGICCEDSDEHVTLQIEQIKTKLSREQQRREEIDLNVQKLTDQLRVLSKDKEESDKNIGVIGRKYDNLYEFVQPIKQDFKNELSILSTAINDELKWIKQKLNENRAAIDDVIEDLYLSEIEKQET